MREILLHVYNSIKYSNFISSSRNTISFFFTSQLSLTTCDVVQKKISRDFSLILITSQPTPMMINLLHYYNTQHERIETLSLLRMKVKTRKQKKIEKLYEIFFLHSKKTSTRTSLKCEKRSPYLFHNTNLCQCCFALRFSHQHQHHHDVK